MDECQGVKITNTYARVRQGLQHETTIQSGFCSTDQAKKNPEPVGVFYAIAVSALLEQRLTRQTIFFQDLA